MATFPLKPRVPKINWNNPITKGLVFDVPFFEGGGLTPQDLVTRAAATLTVNLWAKNIIGSVLSFPGGAGTDKVTLGTNVTGTNYRSISIFFYLNAVDATARRLWDALGPTANIDLLLVNNATNFFEYQEGWNTNATNAAWNYGATPSVGVWHHLVITHDSTSTANVPVMYLDMIPQTLTTRIAPVATVNTTSNGLAIGNSSSLAREFNGYIGYYRRWNRILSPQEVKQLYTNPWQIYRRINLSLFNFGL